ncbi:MAG: hypothetical protein WCD21_01660 [Streptomyces sp.]
MADITGPASRAGSGTSNTLEAPPLQLPGPAGLSEQQVRGRACVWCAVALSNATAIDLGVREVSAHGSSTHWFPRGCRPCAKLHVYRALLDHTQSCEQCNDEPTRCTEGHALRQILKEARRR